MLSRNRKIENLASFGLFFAKMADIFREWLVWLMDFVLSPLYAQHMTFIEICRAEIEKSKIWLVLGYFLQKWLIFLENDWFELWISFSRHQMRNIWLLLRYANPKSKNRKFGYFLANSCENGLFFRKWWVGLMDFVLSSIFAQHMTFIYICKAEIKKLKIWLLMGYFFWKKGWFF